MSSSISSLQQYQMSNMQSEYSALFGTSSTSTDQLMQSMAQAISPTTLSSAAEQATSNNNTNNQLATEQANALVQLSGYANSLYQYANPLQTSTNNGLDDSISAVSNSNANLSVSNTYNVSVSNSATDQQNSGNELTSDSINNFINAYNNMVSFVSQNQQYLNSSLTNQLSNSFQNASSNLQLIGITQNTDGTLAINQDTLNDALQNNILGVQSAFSGVDGIAVSAGDLAQSITQNSLSDYANSSSNTSSTMGGSPASLELYNNFAALQQDYQWSTLINSLV